MFKAVWFQIHWLLGITAGIVLAVVGVTGAMLSFEHEILTALNPGVLTVQPAQSGALPPDVLLERIRANAPGKTPTALTVSADPADPARVTFAPPPPPPGAPAGGPGGPRGENRYVNPYDGALLGDVRGQGFFRFVMQVHRWLAAGDIGKQIVGASTIGLIILSLSGLYLRWPRRALDWRSWLRLDWGRRGRSFLWELHSVIGTWVLPFYLLASLTGLYWSYDWYRGALFDVTGTPRPQQQGPRPAGPPPGAQGAAQGNAGPQGVASPSSTPAAQGERAPRDGRETRSAAPLNVAVLWPAFLRESGGYSTATLRLPQGNAQALTIIYQPENPAHERANNTLVLDAQGQVREHKRYTDLPTGQKLMGSIFPLHSGSFFGVGGTILMMIASLLMPLFAITGWMLYLDRRKKKREARSAAAPVASAVSSGAAPVLVAYASQTGTAERLAFQSASALQAAGLPVKVASLAGLAPDALAQAKRALFVVSTFGEGEPPDAARAFARRMGGRHAQDALAHLDYGVLALGDRSFQRFCGFGAELDAWLRTQGATPLFDRIDVDMEDAGALRHWQQHLGALSGVTTLPDWTSPQYANWRLVHRRQLNIASAGLPTYHLALEPVAGAALAWSAGDIVEIGPRLDHETVRRTLAALDLDGDAPISHGGHPLTLRELLSRSLPPAAAQLLQRQPQELADSLQPLPHREYSIASIPEDGRLELLVRQTRTPDGGYGLGSGWLTRHADEGAMIDLRIRPNPAFHGPEDDRPLILIGNGTGLAGLRAHLKRRIRAGHDANWLIFGERSQAHDFYFRDEITAWQSSGALTRVDLAFSRDQAERIYVQDRLRQAAEEIGHWIDTGAAIYVCGSLQGMAPAVDHVLTELIGAAALERLAEQHRYCRDIY
ncbi:sulfite reductase flavoprotein subunit alpha [Xanthobacter sp. DSM 24535]|uniref:PepSY domain-containing protein n=1 Tax=Roseixanthobacter psychrophilus TaxID=3119917 RepID=UPI0037277946